MSASRRAAPRRRPSARGSDDTPAATPKRAASDLVQMASDAFDLFPDERGEPWAVVCVRGRELLKVDSKKMLSLLAFMARKTGMNVGKTTIEQAIFQLKGIACFERERRRLHLRVAEHEGAIYLDLGDQTGLCVEVTATGWELNARPPVMFRRPDAMRALPQPERGGHLDELRGFVNMADEDSFLLLVAWMVAALRPDRPFPMLALHGEQGSAKSTVSRVLRALADPNAAPLRAPPTSESNLAVESRHSHVLAFDNMSGVQPWLSDALCRLATGGGLSKRTLYTDDDETIIDAIRPIIVNGIDDLANRADLAERCIVLTLKPIAKARRRDEETFWQDFHRVAPRILGVLLSGVSSALRDLRDIRLEEHPRMADFAKWIAAAAPGLGLDRGALLGAYERNRERVIEMALDSSAVATTLRALLDEPPGRWEGTPAACLDALTARVHEATRREPGWPKNPTTLSTRLRRDVTFLRTVGLMVDLDGHEGRGDKKRRVWRFWKREVSATRIPSVPTSPMAETRPQNGNSDPAPLFPDGGLRSRTKAGPGGPKLGPHPNRHAAPLEAGKSGHGNAGDAGDASAGLLDEEDIEREAIIEEGRGMLDGRQPAATRSGAPSPNNGGS
jgi:putative DNA primase/helicase